MFEAWFEFSDHEKEKEMKRILMFILVLLCFVNAGAGAKRIATKLSNSDDASMWNPPGALAVNDTVLIQNAAYGCTLSTARTLDSLCVSKGTFVIPSSVRLQYKLSVRIDSGGTLIVNPDDTLTYTGSGGGGVVYGRAVTQTNVLTFNGTYARPIIMNSSGGYWVVACDLNNAYTSNARLIMRYCRADMAGDATHPGVRLSNNFNALSDSVYINNCLFTNGGTAFKNNDAFPWDSNRVCKFTNNTIVGCKNGDVLFITTRGNATPGNNREFSYNTIHNTKGTYSTITIFASSAQTHGFRFEGNITSGVNYTITARANIKNTFTRYDGGTSFYVPGVGSIADTQNFYNIYAIGGGTNYNSHVYGPNGDGTRNINGFIWDDEYKGALQEANVFIWGGGTTVKNALVLSGNADDNAQNSTYVDTLTACTQLNRWTNNGVSNHFGSYETYNGTAGTHVDYNCIWKESYTAIPFFRSLVSGGSMGKRDYSDYNVMWSLNNYDSAGMWSAVSVGTQAWNTDGWDLHSKHKNPKFRDSTFSLGRWDTTIIPSPNPYEHAYAEMFKINGYDTTGTPATFNQAYTFNSLVASARQAAKPTNDSLRGSGRYGDDFGCVKWATKLIDTITGSDSLHRIDSLGKNYQWGETPDSAKIFLLISQTKGSWTKKCSTSVYVPAGNRDTLAFKRSDLTTGKWFIKTMSRSTTGYLDTNDLDSFTVGVYVVPTYAATMSVVGGGTSTPSFIADSGKLYPIATDSTKLWWAFQGLTGTGGAHITDPTAKSTTVYFTAAGSVTATYTARTPVAPTITHPANGDTGVSTSCAFAWAAVPGDSLVILEGDSVALTGAHSGAYWLDTLAGTSTGKTRTLNNAKTYYVRTYGLTLGTKSAASATVSFTTRHSASGGGGVSNSGGFGFWYNWARKVFKR